MSDDEQINCKKCGDDTNHCPPEFPPEWDGFCPDCAMQEALDGRIPKCSIDALAQQVMGRLGDALGVTIIAIPMGGDDEIIHEDDKHITFAHRICLN